MHRTQDDAFCATIESGGQCSKSFLPSCIPYCELHVFVIDVETLYGEVHACDQLAVSKRKYLPPATPARRSGESSLQLSSLTYRRADLVLKCVPQEALENACLANT